MCIFILLSSKYYLISPVIFFFFLCCYCCHDPVYCSMPGLPALRYLPELAQTYVHLVSDAIQPTHPLSPPSPHALSLDQHQGLF